MSPWLTRFVFTHTRQARPDGRPIYSYKVSDEQYAELKAEVKLMLNSGYKLGMNWSALFCLYAAETFNREYVGGPWSWETIFRPLGVEVPAHSQLSTWIEQGLQWWDRRLIRSKNGHREFLVTIVCEGGLPLSVIQREGASLRRYFLEVLETFHEAQRDDQDAAEDSARTRAYLLPRSLREPEVFRLAGELIYGVVALLREVPTAEDPVNALDIIHPDWRSTLPLRVEEDTAEVLLRGLLKRSGELSRRSTARIRWRGELRLINGCWEVEKRLEIPARVGSDQIRAWTNASTIGSRLRVLLQTAEGSVPIAWLTASSRSDGSEVLYSREWLVRGGGLTLKGAAVADPHQVAILDGAAEFSISVLHGDPWGPTPWVWSVGAEGEAAEFVGEGSIRTRLATALVCCLQDIEPRIAAGAECEFVGEIPSLARAVYRITGACDFVSPEGDRYRVTCSAAEDSDVCFGLYGRTEATVLNKLPVYRGLPGIRPANLSEHRTEWRAVGQSAAWRNDLSAAIGRVWVRLVEVASGIELFRRQVHVLPSDFHLKTEIGSGEASGYHRFSGLHGAIVTVESDAAGQPATITSNGKASATVTCPPIPGAVLPRLSVTLGWPDAGEITLILPYPKRGAGFELNGVPVVPSGLTPISRLDGLRIVVQDPRGGTRYFLRGILSVERRDTPYMFSDPLPPLVEGRLDLPLMQWRDHINSMVVSSSDLEAQVKLQILSNSDEVLACVVVGRFDAFLEPDRQNQLVCIGSASSKMLGCDERNVHVEMMPVWAPADPAISLARYENRDDCWAIPPGLTPGPWWVIAWDGAWARFRPLLWSVSGDAEPQQQPEQVHLSDAVREPDPDIRHQLIDSILSELGDSPDHPDWILLFDYIRFSADVPAAAMDVLKGMIAHPTTMVMALCKSDDETFESVWSLAGQMPFSWTLTAHSDWLVVTSTFCEHLRRLLGHIEAGEEMVWSWFEKLRRRIEARRGYWQPVCDWLQEQLFPGRPLANSSLSFARQMPSLAENSIQQAERDLQGRHDPDEVWPVVSHVSALTAELLPDSRQYRHLAAPYRAVRSAPFVAASVAHKGMPISEKLIYEMRLVRSFDSEWFDQAIFAALCLTLASKELADE